MDTRYSRLLRSAALSSTLEHWQRTNVAVVGCGGLGGGLIETLARWGVGSKGGAKLILIDRDTVDFENLGHQSLFTEAHASAGLPKAVAAAQHVRAINSRVNTEAMVASLGAANVRELLDDAQLVLDGLDSYAVRLLLNDYALNTGKPFFYAGVVRGELSARAIIPGVTGCLRCLLPEPPAPGSVPTCAAEGVFPPLLGMANMLQLAAANKWLAGEFSAEGDILYSFDLDSMQLRRLQLRGPQVDCRACQGRYDYLEGGLASAGTAACAPDTCDLQLAGLDGKLTGLASALQASGEFELRQNSWCLTAQSNGLRYTIFASGRVVMHGSSEPVQLERFVSTYLGV